MSEDLVKPEVGVGATLIYPRDRRPLVIGRIVNARCIEVARVECKSEPEGFHNGFPVHDTVVTPEELAAALVHATTDKCFLKAYLRKDNHYYLGGTPISIGTARYRSDYSD